MNDKQIDELWDKQLKEWEETHFRDHDHPTQLKVAFTNGIRASERDSQKYCGQHQMEPVRMSGETHYRCVKPNCGYTA